ncbi:MAG: hypothetical protein J7574_05575 [Flavobacterium sp.]|uniref:hypothetical protein n=1 Tax=Flavobacterium sp. TaxID=239 RepID=UPI001B23993A|nr:hypothetical protein [Flavobacterium sp.]MBO9583611.1 hypothetical protein [Flavobacterium sp.]
MENKKDKLEINDNECVNENANSAYSGSGSMQPGGSTGEAGRLNDYDEENTEEDTASDEKKNQNPEGKSIEEATDPSKLTKI